MEMVKKFFEVLGERLTHENRISDVLYAAIQSSETMYAIARQQFGFPANEPPEIQREYHDALNGRPDFLIKFPNQTVHLVEVKLYDTDYHYEQYSKIRPEGRVPIITLLTAHKPIEQLNGWKKVLWENLVKEMESSGDKFVINLAHFFRRAIVMEDIKPIQFNSPKAMLYFNRAIRKAIQQYTSSRLGESLPAPVFKAQDDRSGYEYCLRNMNNSQQEAWIRFQVFFRDNFETVCLWLSKRGNKNYDQIVDALRRVFPNEVLKDPLDQQAYMRKMDEKIYKEFLSCGSHEKQLSLLTEFMVPFNRVIEETFSSSNA